MFIQLLKIYLVGVVFLIGALVINLTASKLGLPSWYDFLAKPKFEVINSIWLFVGYPFLLGFLAYLVSTYIGK